jgi:hypothetical protein
MKKYSLLIGIVLLLAVVLVIYTMKKEESSFDFATIAIDESEAFDKIVMRDKDQKEIVLTKKEDGWWVNNEYPAFAPNIDILLNKTLNKVEVKGPVPQNAKDIIIKSLIAKATHVEIFNKDEKIRSYYVGGANAEQNASYLHVEGGETPYLAHIPGFRGVLAPKYSTSVEDWYDKTIFDYTPEQIEWISLVYPFEQNQNFRLLREDTTYAIHPGNTINQVAAKSYFALYKFRNFEGYAPYLTQATKDSIKTSTPFLVITVKPVNQPERELKLFKKGGLVDGRTLYDKNGDPIVEDVERYFATISGFDRLVTVQDYIIGKLLVKRSNFVAPPL